MNIKKTLLILALFPAMAMADTWVDSSGQAVRDDGGAYTVRSNRSTNVSTSSYTPFNVSNITVMTEEVAGALAELEADFGSDGKLVADCSLAAKNVPVISCDKNFGGLTHGSCSMTPNNGMNGFRNKVRNRFEYDGQLEWGAGNYNTASFKTSIPTGFPGFFANHFGIQKRTIGLPKIDFKIEFSKTGYDIYYKGSKVNDDPIGDLSQYVNFRKDQDSVRINSNTVVNFPTIYYPGARLSDTTSTCDDGGGYVDCSNAPTTTTHVNGIVIPYQRDMATWMRFYKPGVATSRGYGQLYEFLEIKALEHIKSMGAYTKTLAISANFYHLKDENNRWVPFYSGYNERIYYQDRWSSFYLQNANRTDTNDSASQIAPTSPPDGQFLGTCALR